MNYKTDTHLDNIIGKKVTKFCIESGEILLEIDNTYALTLYVEGDCCSCSEWTDIIDIDNLLNSNVLMITSDFLSESNWGIEYVQEYGFSIITEKGTCSFCFKNDSHGYYGGWMSVSRHETNLDKYDSFPKNKYILENE